ncbi:BglG family transcription antiterminator [Salipaludibacillus keqinensis]|nr:BglG family transcription antiterminator [Salipaludibacillus keqinensis]
MDIRLQKIIKKLLEVKEPITSSELAASLLVSSKTVRNDIKVLNQQLKVIDARIESYRGKGYQLFTENNKGIQEFLENHSDIKREDIPSKHEERVRFLMERLLFNSDYIKVEDLADTLYISRSTLQNELKTIREILKKYHLNIEQKPHYGIRVIGNEAQIRFCISEYIFNQKSTFAGNSEDWLQILPNEELKTIQDITLAKLREHKTMISDISLQNLITHIAIACKRIREDYSIQMVQDEMLELEKQEKYKVATEIVRDIESSLKVKFSKYEVAYVTIHLQGTKLANSNLKNEEVTSLINDEITDVVTEMIKRIDDKFNLHIHQDEDLPVELSLHLKPAINRYKYNMNIRNPMLEDIKAKYPLSFEAALIGKEVLSEKLNIKIDENEVGYLALHIEVAQERQKKNTEYVPRCLIVCASGLGSAQLLKYKLQTTFGDQLIIMGTTEYHNLSNQSLHNIDFIISTIPIREEMPIPVKTVSTILSDTDLINLEKVISQENFTVETYLREEYTFLNKDFQHHEEVIKFICNKLTEADEVDDTYLDSVLKRENYSPTSFGNLVAIPHPLDPQTDDTFWSIITLKKPILWIDKPVQFVVLLNIAKNNQANLKPMYTSLMQLLDDRNKVTGFLQCKTFDQLKSLIKNME